MKIHSKIPIVALVLFLLMLAFSNFPYFISMNGITTISTWQVARTNNLDAEIKWQIRVHCFTPSTTSPHGSVATSDNFVFFHRTCGLGGKLTALSIQSSEIIWTVPSKYTYQVEYSNNTFFAIEGDSYISGFTTEGVRSWRTTKFPSRSVRYVYSSGNQLFIPRSDYTQIVSIDTGEIIDEINSAILTMNSQYSVQHSEDRIRITDLTTNNSILSLRVPNSEYYLTHTYAQIYHNLALIYSGHSQIHAIELETGDVLWSKEGDFGSVPLLHNGYLYVYENDNTLSLYNPVDGTLLGNIILEQEGSNQPELGVALSASGDFITVAYRNTIEFEG